MTSDRTTREVFRRSILTIALEWTLAGGLALAVGLATHYFGVHGAEGPVLAALPLVWAGGRTVQWACQRWIVEDGGTLVARRGVLIAESDRIDLQTVNRIQIENSSLTRFLGAGHINFDATNTEGVRQRHRWRWMGNHERLCEILRASGQIPIGRPSKWQRLSRAAARLTVRIRAELTTEWNMIQRIIAQLRGQRFAEDYGRFMAFCHHLLRHRGKGQAWPPTGTPVAAASIWMEVLRRTRVVVDATDGSGWSVSRTIASLQDIRRRVGEEELQRAVRRLG